VITLKNVSKVFKDGHESVTVLTDVSLDIAPGQRVAIVGASGSGKSTLLSLLAGLDVPTSGTVMVDGIDISRMNEGDRAQFRNKKVSVIFQAFELVQFFTTFENVQLPLAIRGTRDGKVVDELLESVGLSHRKDNLPAQLSGGEQQRVAIARALASDSVVIFADEPTGNLDAATGKKVLELLLESVRVHKKTFVIITHDMHIASKMDVVYELKDGKVSLARM
jgi:putative ABC transport system ATP-binding protein